MFTFSIDNGLAHHQKVGRLVCQHQRTAAGHPVETMHVVKEGRTGTTKTPVGGVGGVASVVCPSEQCILLFKQPTGLVRHWGDCHEPYVWYYYCTLCKNWQKLSCEAVSHVRDHVQHSDVLNADSLHQATISRPNGSCNFHNPGKMRPQLDIAKLIHRTARLVSPEKWGQHG